MIKNNEEFIVCNVNKKEQKIREGNIEVLRFILCIFVILIHSFDGDFIFPFTYGVVSCFAMINGFLFLSLFSAFAFFSLFKTFNIKFNKFIKFLSVMATLLYAYHEGVMNFLNIWFNETSLDHISRWKFMNYFFKFIVILSISIGFSILFYYPFIIYSKFTNKKMTKLIECINKDKIKRIETKKNCWIAVFLVFII